MSSKRSHAAVDAAAEETSPPGETAKRARSGGQHQVPTILRQFFHPGSEAAAALTEPVFWRVHIDRATFVSTVQILKQATSNAPFRVVPPENNQGRRPGLELDSTDKHGTSAVFIQLALDVETFVTENDPSDIFEFTLDVARLYDRTRNLPPGKLALIRPRNESDAVVLVTVDSNQMEDVTRIKFSITCDDVPSTDQYPLSVYWDHAIVIEFGTWRNFITNAKSLHPDELQMLVYEPPALTKAHGVVRHVYFVMRVSEGSESYEKAFYSHTVWNTPPKAVDDGSDTKTIAADVEIRAGHHGASALKPADLPDFNTLECRYSASFWFPFLAKLAEINQSEITLYLLEESPLMIKFNYGRPGSFAAMVLASTASVDDENDEGAGANESGDKPSANDAE